MVYFERSISPRYFPDIFFYALISCYTIKDLSQSIIEVQGQHNVSSLLTYGYAFFKSLRLNACIILWSGKGLGGVEVPIRD